MESYTPQSVGLGGDGDEIAAIMDVESAFGVKLDYTKAGKWVTAGDVFDALRDAMRTSAEVQPDLWERFATALCATTGVDPHEIEPASPLLSQDRFWGRMADVSAATWIVVAVGLAAVIGISFFKR